MLPEIHKKWGEGQVKKICNWFIHNASMQKKLIISYIILVSIPLCILGIHSFSAANQNLLDQTEVTMDNNLHRMCQEADAIFQRETDFTKYLAYNLEFRQTLEGNAYNGSAIAQSLNKTVEPVFWYFITSDENLKMIKIVTPNTASDIGSFLESAEPYEDTVWYKKLEKDFNTEWTVEEDGKLYATRTILDTATTSRRIGVLRAEFYLNRILEPFDTMDYLDNGIVIKDGNGQVIYTKKIADEQMEQKIEVYIGENPEDASVLNKEYILKEASMEKVDWKIYYFIDRNTISEQIYSIIFSTIIVVLICVGLTLVVIGVLSRVIGQRILQLRDQAERIANGDLQNPCHTTDTDEVGMVTNSLGRMTVQLDSMINEVYKMEIEKKESELRALQAQMNPHFLYNCLSGIKWKALRKGDDDISDITGLLAKFYRTALNNGQQITTVSSELENIRAYIEIQKKMHEEPFEVEYRIDESGLECCMPNFLLQPLVENAMKHGIDYMEEPDTGKIIVEFCRKPEQLVFSIYNNGPLIELEMVEKLLNEQGKGYGIHNIKERLELYYGALGSLEVKVTDAKYTCFTVKMPDTLQKKNPK